jgi:hypothetical protein
MILHIIGRKIKDKALLKLLQGMLKAGYVEDWHFHQTYSGTPQGGILSPLIANIVLNELDAYIEDVLIPKYTNGKKRKWNPEYTRITARMQKLKRKRHWERHARYKQLQRYRRHIPAMAPHDPEYSRLRYVRYADDFLLGFTGPKADAERIKEDIRQFLKTIGLELSEDKTVITHAATEKARFLNYHISIQWDDTKMAVRATDDAKTRSINGQVSLTIPRDVSREWRAKVSRKGRYWHRAELIHLSDYDIISTYETELQGLINYYTMAHDIEKMRRLRHAWLMSLLKTLAAKHHSSVKKTYAKYKRYMPEGRTVIAVEIPREGKKPLRAIFGKQPIRQDRNIVINDTMEKIYTTSNQLITRLLANRCELCGNTVGIAVHHIRKLKDLKRRYQGRRAIPTWVKKMIAIRRKTLVVCRHCHQAIHAGTYDGAALA